MSTLFAENRALSMRVGMFWLLSIVLMIMDGNGQASGFRVALDSAMYPIHLATTLPINALDWASEGLSSRKALLEDNRELRDALFRQESRLQRLSVLEQENARLYRLLEVADKVKDRVKVAGLLAADINAQRQHVSIDKGERDGAYIGQPIMDAYGIMGQITAVTAFSSKVLLITDPNHSLPVQIDRNGLRGYATGIGDARRLRLEYLPADNDVQPGDLVVTSGLGQRFPPGYVVGEVRAVRLGLDLGIVLEPAARLEQSREVLMIWPARFGRR